MFCINCGEKIEEGSKFCAHCGSSQNAAAQNSTKANSSKPEIKMGEIRICPKKPSGMLRSVEYYIYVDDVMYKWSSKNDKPIVITATPEIHFIQVSKYKLDTKKKYDSFGKMAGEVGGSGLLGSAGAIIGLSASLAASITSGVLKSEEDVCAVDLTGGTTAVVSVTMNMMGKMKVWEE